MKKLTFFLIVVALVAGYFFFPKVMGGIGGFLVVDDPPAAADAILVLNTGDEYYPRLVEAAGLYNEGWARQIVINGNRKTDVLRELERKGFTRCCEWYEDSARILGLYGVPRTAVIALSAEDAYDSITEARAVGPVLIGRGFNEIILTTSKYHTRRARNVWRHLYAGKMSVIMVAAKDDPFDPKGWWKHGRQVRWVMAEYGAWVFYYWQRVSAWAGGMAGEAKALIEGWTE